MEPGDSIGDSLGLCQMCWEEFCSVTWWAAHQGEHVPTAQEWMQK